MYEVMARRYRPALFDDVVGQEHIASTLKNAITRDRVAHAFIFTGGHGCGKTTMARILAKALVCQTGPTPTPCCTCPICIDVAAGRDADVLEIDGASNNGIEQIRALREQAAYVPTRARYKIYIIDEVHMLSDGAFNALLKTLEEPPQHVKFILATTDPHKVPDTILSRCQRFDFRLVPQATLAAFFRQLATKENAAITDDALDAVAAFAGGSVRDGLVLLDQLLSFSDGEVGRGDVESLRGAAAAESVAGIYTHIVNADVAAALSLVDEVASRGTSVGDFLDQLISFGRDLMILIAGGEKAAEGISAYGPARETLFDLAKRIPLESALLYLDVFAAARTRVRQRALTNPLVSLEMAVARLAGLGGITPVAEIIGKLENLPQVVSGTPTPSPVPQISPKPQQNTAPAPSPQSKETVALPDRQTSRHSAGADAVQDTSATANHAVMPVQPSPQQGHPVAEPTPSEPAQTTPQQRVQVKADAGVVLLDDHDTRRVEYPFDPDNIDELQGRQQGGSRPAASSSSPEPEQDIQNISEKKETEPEARPLPDATPAPGGTQRQAKTPESADSGLTPELVKEAWSAILDKVAEKHAPDLGYVLRTFFDGVEDGQIVLSGSRTTVESWEDKRRLGRLTEAVESVLGMPVSFKFVARKERRKGTDSVKEERSQERNLLNNPVVDSVRSLFDGVIIAHRGIEDTVENVESDDDASGEEDV